MAREGGTGTGFAGAKLSEILRCARVARFAQDDRLGGRVARFVQDDRLGDRVARFVQDDGRDGGWREQSGMVGRGVNRNRAFLSASTMMNLHPIDFSHDFLFLALVLLVPASAEFLRYEGWTKLATMLYFGFGAALIWQIVAIFRRRSN